MGGTSSGMRTIRLSLSAAALTACLSVSAMAGQNYPPYPDVWERELAPGEGSHWYSAYGQPDGEIALLFQGASDEFPGYRVDFFSGRDSELSRQQFWILSDRWEGSYPTPYGRPFTQSEFEEPRIFETQQGNVRIFRSGFEFSFKRDEHGPTHEIVPNKRWMCVFGDFVHEIWQGDTEVARKVIVRRRPEPVMADVGGGTYQLGAGDRIWSDDCQKSLSYGHYRTRIAFWKLLSHPHLALADGTFLAVVDSSQRDAGADEWNRRIVLRMRPDLTSPALERRSDVHVIDFTQIEPILKESERRAAADPSFNDAEFIAGRVADLIDADTCSMPSNINGEIARLAPSRHWPAGFAET